MVTCQASELGWEVTVELPADFLSLGRRSVRLMRVLHFWHGDKFRARFGGEEPKVWFAFTPFCVEFF